MIFMPLKKEVCGVLLMEHIHNKFQIGGEIIQVNH
jgi:hypothetical protein